MGARRAHLLPFLHGGLALAAAGQIPGESNASKTGSAYGYATVAYNAAIGAQLWVKRYSGSATGDPFGIQNAIAVSPATGTVFVTGTNEGSYATIAYSG